jgi:gamma-glutamylcyclotransferase (GGCT)/AIG2-like uncharacterized protein YtfP
LFLYGTLNDPGWLVTFARRPVPVTSATLRGWRRVALLDSRYPTLRRARTSVAGVLATVDRPTLARLAAYEGRSYRLTPVVVHAGRRRITARAWIAPGGTSREWLPRSRLNSGFLGSVR